MIDFRMFVAVAAAFLIGTSALSYAGASSPVPDYVLMAVNDRGRTPWDFQRDARRKPAQVLAFSEIKPGMTVADVVSGDGYYTRLLARLVGPNGKVYAVVPDGGAGVSRSAHIQKRAGKPPSMVPLDRGDACTLGCYPDGLPPYMLPIDYIQALENTTDYKNVVAYWEDLGAFGGDLALPKQVDAVVIVDGYHHLHSQQTQQFQPTVLGRVYNRKPLNMPEVLKSVYGTMKPGGILLIADYAAAKGAGFSKADALQRVEAAAVKAEVTAAGFSFDGESNALVNGADNHASSVEGVAANRDAADQFLMRFKKPTDASPGTKRPKNENAIMKNYYGNTMVVGVDLDKGMSSTGDRIRTVYYNKDHTYQEFGRLDEGPGPMQMGTWFWDAEGHNCQLHQFPIDERSNIVCHIDVFARPVGVVRDQNPGGGGKKVEIVKGHILNGYILP